MHGGTQKKIAILVDLDNLFGGIRPPKSKNAYLKTLVLLEKEVTKKLTLPDEAITERYAYVNFLNHSNRGLFSRLELPVTYQVFNTFFPQWSQKSLADGLIIGKAIDLIKDIHPTNPRITDIVLVTGDSDIILPIMSMARKYQKGFFIASIPETTSDSIVSMKNYFFDLEKIVQGSLTKKSVPEKPKNTVHANAVSQVVKPPPPLKKKKKKKKRRSKKKASAPKTVAKQDIPKKPEVKEAKKEDPPKPPVKIRFRPIITPLVSKRRNGGNWRGNRRHRHIRNTSKLPSKKAQEERLAKIPPVDPPPSINALENGTLTQVQEVFNRISDKQSVTAKTLRTELLHSFDDKSPQEVDFILLAFIGQENVSIKNGMIHM